MRKPIFAYAKTKRISAMWCRANDQCLCFNNIDSTSPLLLKSETSIVYPSTVDVQPGLCQNWSETPVRFSFEEAQMETCIIIFQNFQTSKGFTTE